MTTTGPHIIQKQVFDLHLPSAEGTHNVQEAWSRHYQEVVLPRLSELFDLITPGGQIIRLDRLEIDLGTIELGQLESKLLEEFGELLRSFNEDSYSPEAISGGKKLTPKQELIEAFTFFLESGILPWWTSVEKIPDQEKAILEILPELSPIQLEHITKFVFVPLVKEEYFNGDIKELERSFFKWRQISTGLPFQRLVAQFSDELIIQLLRKIFLIPSNQVLRWRQKAQETISTTSVQGTGPKRLAIWFLIIHEVHKFTTLKTQKSEMLADMVTTFKKVNNEIIQEGLGEVVSSELIEVSKQERKILRSKEGYHIENAGLVLIAPYLERFFEAIGLMQETRFISTYTQQRAIHLLQYLAGSPEQSPEYLLVLNKILCHWPFEKPVERNIKLSEKEKAEAKKLLQAVIRNWSALKNTSIAVLQESFLQRKGKLVYIENKNAWLLEVESKPYDMLLSRLPWTYSMVKLLWMPEILEVKW